MAVTESVSEFILGKPLGFSISDNGRIMGGSLS